MKLVNSFEMNEHIQNMLIYECKQNELIAGKVAIFSIAIVSC